jgi:hypothetical protein
LSFPHLLQAFVQVLTWKHVADLLGDLSAPDRVHDYLPAVIDVGKVLNQLSKLACRESSQVIALCNSRYPGGIDWLQSSTYEEGTRQEEHKIFI